MPILIAKSVPKKYNSNLINFSGLSKEKDHEKYKKLNSIQFIGYFCKFFAFLNEELDPFSLFRSHGLLF
jgi:hypothetical protein